MLPGSSNQIFSIYKISFALQPLVNAENYEKANEDKLQQLGCHFLLFWRRILSGLSEREKMLKIIVCGAKVRVEKNT